MTSRLPVVNPQLYPQLLAAKADKLRQIFAPFNPPELEIFASPPSHYRMRTEFRVWHEGADLFYAMFEVGANPKTDRRLIRMDNYPVAGERINQLMPQLLDAIREQPLLRQRLFQVEFLTTLAGDALITLIYHRQLTAEWAQAAGQLQDKLGVKLVGRARKQKLVLNKDYVWETLEVAGRQLHYKQIEGSFTQPNPWINQAMLTWAQEVTSPVLTETASSPSQDLLELYCGNGNFTLALAPNFRQVLGTEVSRTSVAAAQDNIQANSCTNVRIERCAAEDMAAKLEQTEYDFSTLLVDPPRAGLDTTTLELAQKFERLVYISCNPLTLAANLASLSLTHRIHRLAFFDQFPYTEHAECGVYLIRRG